MSYFLQRFRSPLESQIPPQDLCNFERRLAAKLSHFWRQMDSPGFPQHFAEILGNWHFWRGIISQANRELKCPTFCNILRLLLSAIFSRELGNFGPWLSAELGHFWRQAGWPCFSQNFGKVDSSNETSLRAIIASWNGPFYATLRASSWEPDPRDLRNFEPRLDSQLGHFRRRMDRPGFPQNFGKIPEIWHF